MTGAIKIFGERNTSTNALKALIEKNAASRVVPLVAKELNATIEMRLAIARKLGVPMWYRDRMIDRVYRGRPPLESWKHAATDFDDLKSFEGVHIVFCIRHPASWVLGLYRRPYHIPHQDVASLAEFLDRRWQTVERERLGGAEVGATELYNRKIASYHTLQTDLTAQGIGFTTIRHEDFAQDQEGVFAALAPHLSAPAETLQPLESSTKDKTKTRAYYQDYYGNELWRKDIDPESMARIAEEIDWAAVSAYGYTLD